jgi:diaminopimelate epimerase
MKQPIEFAKMAGGGNDFVIIDNRGGAVDDPGALAQAVCVRRLSVGADGLILIENSSRADLKMVYHNADGSHANFCANGTRCAARFCVLNGLSGPRLTLETDAGLVPAVIDRGNVSLDLWPPADDSPDFALDIWPEVRTGSRIVVGVPHWVTFVDRDLWGMDVVTPGRAARYHEKLRPEGANINFVSVKSRERIDVRTYERGVEDETLSCGSGVVASVCVAAMKQRVVSPVTVLTRSGIEFTVAFRMEEGGLPQSIVLTGDARLVYRSTITEETLTGFDPRWARNPTSAPPRP